MSPGEIITLIGKTNKISIVFFVITCVLLGYEFYLYMKDKKGNKKPTVPLFKKGDSKEPLSIHTPKPTPTPPPHPEPAHSKTQAPLPPLIAQMSPPTMKHSPPLGRKKKKMSRGAKVTIGATLALMVLTVGIAWRLNQPSSQQASNTTSARADEQLTPGAGFLPGESSSSALTVPSVEPTITSSARSLIPTITPRSDIIDLSQGGSTTDDFEPIATPTSQISSGAEATESAATTSTTESVSTSSSEIAQLPQTGASDEATLAPTLPIAGTIQYSIGLLVVASVIVIASLIF